MEVKISATDPATFVGACAILAAVALLACTYRPRVHPLIALHCTESPPSVVMLSWGRILPSVRGRSGEP